MPAPAAGPIHVLQVASGDLWGGAEAQLLELSVALKELPDVQVSAAILNFGRLAEQLTAAGIDTTVLDEAQQSSAMIIRRLVALIRRLKPDIVHTHRRKENVLGGFAARLTRTPSVRTIHGAMEVFEPTYRFDKQLYGLLDRWAASAWQAMAIAVSSELADELGRGQRFPSRICVIRNGISAARVQAAAASNPHLPDTGSRVRLAFVGRLVPVKRVDRILKAVRILLEDEPDMYALFVVGSGPERAKLIELAKNFGITYAAHFLGERPDAIACLDQMDALLLASEHEGLPMVTLEALCLGVPPIVPPIGGLPGLIAAAGFGCIASSASPEDLAQAIRSSGLKRRQEAPDNRLPRAWSIEHSSTEHVRLYRSLLQCHSTQASAMGGAA